MRRQLTLAILFAGAAQAAFAALPTPVSVTTIWIDESGNSSRTLRSWHDTNGNFVPDCNLLNPLANGECSAIRSLTGTPIPATLGVDPGPGGLNAVPTYTLPPSLGAGTPGDVILSESGPASDVIRFNGDRTVTCRSGAGVLVARRRMGIPSAV